MKYLLFLFFLLTSLLHAISFELKTDSLDELYQTISTQKALQSIKKCSKVNFSSLNKSSFKLDDKKDTQLKMLQNDLITLKRLQVNLRNDTTRENARVRLKRAFFTLNANLNHQLTFAWVLKYPASLDYEKVYTQLQQEISLYVLQTYGVANVAYQLEIQNLAIKSQDINTQTIGTVELVPSNYTNPFRYSQENTIKSGLLVLNFYPFVLTSRQKSITTSLADTTINKNITTLFVDLQKENNINSLKKYLSNEENELFNSYLASFQPSKDLSIDQELQKIASNTNSFVNNLNAMFKKYSHCKTLGCIEKELHKKIDLLSDFGGEREFVYDIYLSNDIQYKYALQTALMELRDKLAQDTAVRTIDDKETLINDNYSRKTNESTFKPVYKFIEILPFLQNNRIGIRAIVRLSFEASDLCTQYYLGETRAISLGMVFSKLMTEDGSEIEVAQTNITNKQYNRIVTSKRQEGCEPTTLPDQPVNCLSDTDIDTFLAKLNAKNDAYNYRLLNCDEWLLFATCGNKQKFCWGNRNNFKPYEFIIKDIYSFKLNSVALKKPNALNLFDLCGNGYEYCIGKYKNYKCATTDTKTLEPKIKNPSWPDINTLRLVREKI